MTRSLVLAIGALALAGCYLSTERVAIDAPPSLDGSSEDLDGGAPRPGSSASSATLALRGHDLFWVDRAAGAVVRQRPGGAPSRIAETVGAGGYAFITVTETDVLWFAGTALMRVPLAGGPATEVADGVSPLALAADEERVYFSPLPAEPSAPEGILVELSLATGARRSLAGGAVGVALVGAELVTADCAGGLWRRHRDGGPRVALAPDTFCPFTVAVDDGEIYYWDWDRSSPMHDGYAIWRVGLEGGAPQRVSAADGIAFAVAGPFVYASHDGAIVRSHIDGGEAIELVRARARGVAVDGETLYWTEPDEDGTTVLRQRALPR